MNYYNENNPFAAAWLRELIAAGLISDGIVDDRSICDVQPTDISGFSQCHFFAGIGVWSYALRLAGWPDDRPVWTGSCPCQPFSNAGKRRGISDERHLWPEFWRLARIQKPDVVFGEQVAGAAGYAWFDVVSADLESGGYAVGAVDTPACGFGAPHIRQRLYWVALAGDIYGGGYIERMADTREHGWPGRIPGWAAAQWETVHRPSGCRGATGGLEYPGGLGRQRRQTPASGDNNDGAASVGAENQHGTGQSGAPGVSGCSARALDGFWRAADWLLCRDGKWRPVEPGTSPLADGIACRVGRLRGYGNAIVAPQAATFIQTVMETIDVCKHDQTN